MPLFVMCLVWLTEGEGIRGDIDTGRGRDLGGVAGKNGVDRFGCGLGPMERAGGRVSRQKRLTFGERFGLEVTIGGDQDLGGRCKRKMDESTHRGITKRGKEKSKIMRKRGECVLTEAKRVKGFYLRTGTHC